MRKYVLYLLVLTAGCKPGSREREPVTKQEFRVISREQLMDKIKGAWVAQTVGVTFGAPIEFNYNATFVRDNQKIDFNDSSMYVEFRDRPGTYDDVYMDLTFMKLVDEKGVDAPAKEFAEAFAHKDYKLWFANQTARYNVLNGLEPPASGYWLNNPCADDIDFQIESDFAGLMFPGMVNSAVGLCDKVGHIMNYGDGWYGGVFVASTYALALVADSTADIEQIIREALGVIPPESKFSQCLNDVIKWHTEDPVDWKATWFKTIRKWGVDIGSPLGVFRPFDIDAKINAAWVVMGLLYGNGDFTRTFQVAVRCGDDADCNPGTAGGILAAIKGYHSIPAYWTAGLDKIEDTPFMGASISLSQAYEMSYRHALAMIERNGGRTENDSVYIKLQQPETVPLEVSFEGHYPVARVVPETMNNTISFEFDGIGFALAAPPDGRDYGKRNLVFNTEMYIDGKLAEKVKLPTAVNQRRFTPFWKYQLPRGHHRVQIKILNPVDYARVQYNYAVIYDDKPFEMAW